MIMIIHGKLSLDAGTNMGSCRQFLMFLLSAWVFVLLQKWLKLLLET